jgi:hypothetical protein
MVEDMGIKEYSIEVIFNTSTEFYKNLLIGSKFISGGYTENGNRISLILVFKKSRLKGLALDYSPVKGSYQMSRTFTCSIFGLLKTSVQKVYTVKWATHVIVY